MGTPRSRGDVGQRLLQLKRELEEKRDARAQLQGELKSLQKQLLEDFRVETLEQAKESIERMDERIQKMGQEIQDGIETIEGMMGE